MLVGNYAYDQVNKALMLGIGVDTEIWGLRKTALAACPELARYIGEINRFKRKHPEVLMRGTFRDTVGAHVVGDCLLSVLEGPGRSRAVVLRNPHPRSVRTQAHMPQSAGPDWLLWRPFRKETAVRCLPLGVTLRPYEAAVLLARETARGPTAIAQQNNVVSRRLASPVARRRVRPSHGHHRPDG